MEAKNHSQQEFADNDKKSIKARGPSHWDSPAKNDQFGREPFVDAIVTTIEDADEGFNFGISARWGEGKSSILAQLQPKLEKLNYKVLRFEPWKYTQDEISIKRKFIIDICSQLGEPIDATNLYGTKEIEEDLKPEEYDKLFSARLGLFFRYAGATAIAILTTLWLVQEIFGVDINITQIFLSNLFVPIVIGLFPVIQKILEIRVKQILPKMESAEQFEAKFNDVISKLMGNNDSPKRVVIFVDDLDRCSHEEVEQVLTALFTFFSNEHCIYVITADHTVIRRYIGKFLGLDDELKTDGDVDLVKTNQVRQREATEYLKKIFQVNFILPKATREVLQPWLEALLADLPIIQYKNPYAKQYLIDLILNNFDSNPRKMKHFVRTLAFQLDAVHEKIEHLDKKEGKEYDNLNLVKDSPELLAKILVIQDQFPDFYEQLPVEPRLLQQYESGALADNADLKKLLSQEPKFFNSINRPDAPTIDPYYFLHFSGSTGFTETRTIDPTELQTLAKSGDFSSLGKIIAGLTDEPRNSYIADVKKLIDAPQTLPPEKINVIRSLFYAISLLEEPRLRLQGIKDLIDLATKYPTEFASVQAVDLEKIVPYMDSSIAKSLLTKEPFIKPETRVQILNVFVSQQKVIEKKAFAEFLTILGNMFDGSEPDFVTCLGLTMKLEPEVLTDSSLIQEKLVAALKTKPVAQKEVIIDAINKFKPQFSQPLSKQTEELLLDFVKSDNITNTIFVLSYIPTRISEQLVGFSQLSKAVAEKIENIDGTTLPQVLTAVLRPEFIKTLGHHMTTISNSVIELLDSSDESKANQAIAKIKEMLLINGVSKDTIVDIVKSTKERKLAVMRALWGVKDMLVGDESAKKEFLAIARRMGKGATNDEVINFVKEVENELDPKPIEDDAPRDS